MLAQMLAMVLIGQCPGGVSRPSGALVVMPPQAPAFPPQVAGMALAPEGARIKVKVRGRGFHPFRRRCHG